MIVGDQPLAWAFALAVRESKDERLWSDRLRSITMTNAPVHPVLPGTSPINLIDAGISD
jgi:hypothetical protein